MYYYTYKIVLQKGSLAGKCYYGQHTTDNLLDGYCGSGIFVRKYYKKYGKGRDSYRMYIQKFCNNKEELDQAEKELVSKHLGKDYCLNIAAGGTGGYTGLHTEEQKKKMSVAAKASMTPERRAKISATNKANMTPERRAKISAATKGDKNPRAKSITILNLITNEILTFSCVKDCAEYLQVDTHGTFRTKFLKGLPTTVPQLKNYRVISSDIREVV